MGEHRCEYCGLWKPVDQFPTWTAYEAKCVACHAKEAANRSIRRIRRALKRGGDDAR